MPVQILSTKLSIPPLHSRLVRRNRLIQKLNRGLEYGLILISAPAGYGKSTLLSAWLSQVAIPVAWLSLDEGDNDPPRFLAYLAATLHGNDPSIAEFFDRPQNLRDQPDIELLLTPLINHISQHKHPFYLVLDDYHLIQDQTVHQFVNFLLDHRPAPMHLVIATRADPPLPLAKLRARSEMLEIRLADLRFSSREAADFLNRTMDLQISPTDVDSITTRTEGWIAGLQIAALSMQNIEDTSGFIASLAGSDYYIFDYLVKEILSRQSPEIRKFLLYTSILDQLTAPLCDALLAVGVESAPFRPSADILKELERANLFLIPIDHEHRWFRYHHLFSDLLRVILEQTCPGYTVELHHRACCWYEAQDMLPEALQHAISSGDMQLVAKIVSANVLILLENDEVRPTLQKIDMIPQDELIALPWLGIARAWVLGAVQSQNPQQILDAVESSLKNSRGSVERQQLKGYIAAARAFLFCAQGDTDNTIAHAKLANETLPEDEIAVRAMNLIIWGDVLVDEEKDPGAMPILERAMALALQARKPHLAVIAMSALANLYHHSGMLWELQSICLEALAIAKEYENRYQRPLSATAEMYSLLARVYVEWGENEKAIQFARQGLSLSERWGLVNIEALCLSHLGRVLILSNDWEQARQVFQRADVAAKKVSTWYYQLARIFALDSMLDCEAPESDELIEQVHHLQENGASIPPALSTRLLIREGHPEAALTMLEGAIKDLEGQLSVDLVRLHGLRSLAYQVQGDEKQALASLQVALKVGEPDNRIASFVREGAAMEKLLRLAHASGIYPTFVRRLLAAFEARRKPKQEPVVTDMLIEPLSNRELQVLQLLAQGCSDKVIAETLVIARETVHKYLGNIYSKLDVHSRMEAILRARELGLL